MGQAFPKRYLMHKARTPINSFLGIIGPFLETSDAAGMGQGKARSSSDFTKTQKPLVSVFSRQRQLKHLIRREFKYRSHTNPSPEECGYQRR